MTLSVEDPRPLTLFPYQCHIFLIFSNIHFPNLSTTYCFGSLTLDMADALLALPSSPHYFVLPSPTMSELGCLTEVRTIRTD